MASLRDLPTRIIEAIDNFQTQQKYLRLQEILRYFFFFLVFANAFKAWQLAKMKSYIRGMSLELLLRKETVSLKKFNNIFFSFLEKSIFSK